VSLILLFCGATPHAQEPAGVPTFPAAAQAEADEYTRYELLVPETASFKIFYEVTATTPGAKVYFNPIPEGERGERRGGLRCDDWGGAAIEVVSGAEARKDPLMPDADLAGNYIKVQLARAVPAEGQGAS